MRKIKLSCCLCIFLLSSTVNATIDHGYNNPRGAMPAQLSDTAPSNKNALINGKMVASENCGITEFLETASTDIPDYLIDNDTDCFSFFFDNQNSSEIFSEANYLQVATAARDAAADYDGSQDIGNYFQYLRAADFIGFFHPDSINFSDEMHQAMEDAMLAFQNLPNFVSIETESHGRLLSEWVAAADGTSNWHLYYETAKEILNQITEFRTERFWYRAAYNDALFFLFRGQVNRSEPFIEILSNDTELPNILANLASNELVIENANFLSSNAVVELGRLLNLPGNRIAVRNAIETLLAQTERLSQNWLALMTAIDISDEDCNAYTVDICADESLVREITARAFPNTFVFDGGAMTFETALSLAETEQIYYQLKEAEATFFKVTGATTPVAGDVNNRITFRIYGSLQDYESFQLFLFGLPTDNGGIYIERQATLYTWDRTPRESFFTLEELARHEYMHYLIGRFLVPGFWNETDMYDNDRITWFDEGMASFLAGGTQYDGVWPLTSMVGRLVDRTSHITPAQTMRLTYSDAYLYPYSALILNFLHDSDSAAIQQMVEALRNDDVVGFDTITGQIGAIEESDFSAYINSWGEKLDTIQTPWKDYLTADALIVSEVADIQAVFENEFSGLVSTPDCRSKSETQFSCDMQFEYTIQNSNLPLYELQDEVDLLTKSFVDSNVNNLRTINCFANNIGASVQSIHCEGGLNGALDSVRAPTPESPTEMPTSTPESTPDAGSETAGPISVEENTIFTAGGAISLIHLWALFLLLGSQRKIRRRYLRPTSAG